MGNKVREYSSLPEQGEQLDYYYSNADSQPYSTLKEQGELIGYQYAEGYSEAGGSKIKKGIKNAQKNRAAKLKLKAADKAATAKNNAAAIKALNKTDKPIILPPLPKEQKKSGLIMGAKIGIGVGILTVFLGVIGFIIYKKKKNAK